MLRSIKASLVLIAALPLMASGKPAAPRVTDAAAVFALLDNNEWCPGGSVYLDLQTGSFLLLPRLARPACSDPKSAVAVERGTLGPAPLRRLRSFYAEARRAGLEREPCEFVISNGGPQAVVITAPAYSAKTPDNEGCWSPQANALYNELYRVFGRQRLPRHSTYKSATSSEEALMDEIERAVVLPNGANPLDAYGRNYAFTGAGTVVAVYLLPSGANRRPSATQMPAGERRWYRDASDLPGLSDRGCMQVTVDYDIATHRVLGVACN